MSEPKIYLDTMTEALGRLDACERYLTKHTETFSKFELESAALQMRKAMEAIAFAAIAPNKQQYAITRRNAERSADFSKDWQADTIFLILKRINAHFYPDPLLEPTQVSHNRWHFEKPLDGYMKQKEFETLYKRLGKYLHADNPWGQDKGWGHLALDLSKAIAKIRALLKKHRTTIKAQRFYGIWIVDAPSDGTPPRMIQAEQLGPSTPNTKRSAEAE